MGLPAPELDDKTFEQLVNEARLLIPRYAPEWTDHNLHDPGITFIDLFAWLAEMQLYQLNRLTPDQYKKFLQLVGISPAPDLPCCVNVAFTNITKEKKIEAGTPIIAKMGQDKIIFKTINTGNNNQKLLRGVQGGGFLEKSPPGRRRQDITLYPFMLASVITVLESREIDNTGANEEDSVYFYPFGETVSPGAEMRLGFKETPLGEKVHLFFMLYEDDLPPVTAPGQPIIPSVELAWEYLESGQWYSLKIEKDTTRALNKSGYLVFTFPTAMDTKNELNWIRCRVKQGRYEIVPIINRILLNTIPAVQIEAVEENLGDGTGFPHQVIKLKKEPIIPGTLKIKIQAEDKQWEEWEQVEDFEDSGPQDRHYTFNPEKGEITFGSGLNGLLPGSLKRIRASYETTMGAKINIPKGQVFKIENEDGKVIQGTTPGKAVPGKDAETIEHAKNRAKKESRNPDLAVTAKDYEKLALQTPGLRVVRAHALPNYHPGYPCISMPGAVTVVAVPYARKGTVTPVPGQGFLETLQRHLDSYRLVTTDVHVIGPEYVKISVTCTINIKKKTSPIEVEKRVKKALDEFLDPLPGVPVKKGWPFGRWVFPSEIYQVIDLVEGVDYAIGVTLSANGTPYPTGTAVPVPRWGLVFPGEHHIEIDTSLTIKKRKPCQQ